MTDAAEAYLAHLGIEVTGDELAHYGKKGMKWGVRNDKKSGSSAGSRWTEDQKNKAKVVGGIALIAAIGVGTFIASNTLSAYGPDALHMLNPATKKYKPDVNSAAKIAEMTRKAAAGRAAAAATMAAHGAKPAPKLDPQLAKFIKDAPARLLSDQKGWSEAFGKSLGKIQAEDAAFIADHIKNYVPKALGA